MQKIILTICLVMLIKTYPVDAALWYSSGYNTFTDSDPQGEEIFVENDAILDFLSGTAFGLRVIHTATANIYGGTITYDLYTSGDSVTNIYLTDLDILWSDHDSIVNIYAYDVTFYSTGGSSNVGYMTGIFYKDDINFSVDFYHPDTVSHVNVVPEPATLLLFTFGGLLLRRTRNQFNQKKH